MSAAAKPTNRIIVPIECEACGITSQLSGVDNRGKVEHWLRCSNRGIMILELLTGNPGPAVAIGSSSAVSQTRRENKTLLSNPIGNPIAIPGHSDDDARGALCFHTTFILTTMRP